MTIGSVHKREVKVFKNIYEMTFFVIERWIEISESAINKKGRFEAGLSGGRTPTSLYQGLSEFRKLPWERTHIFLVDERFVPYESSENNYHMINQTLLRHINIPEENIHSIPTQEKTLPASAEKYERDLISHFKLSQNEFPRFDLILLGMGEDGHTASIFPDTPAVKERTRLVTAVAETVRFRNDRITVTMPVINNAENVIFMVSGYNKANAVKRVIGEEDSLLPASMVNPKKGKLYFLVDEEAAAYL